MEYKAYCHSEGQRKKGKLGHLSSVGLPTSTRKSKASILSHHECSDTKSSKLKAAHDKLCIKKLHMTILSKKRKNLVDSN